ncbi:hypothetical protein AM587_10011949 [Phytophthora nicotianae]|uniref:Uncharacterized protein n=1 Tax=Phytophthora nicotianae TaxID=4792 RepID=A0A0W8CP03_PHYNI|nr:hypothetical protein AM587_10011949 [Phytophthora nicotianae]
MRTKRLFSTWSLVVLLAAIASRDVVSDCDESSHSVRGHAAKQARVATEVASETFTPSTADSVEEGSVFSASSSYGIASSIEFPTATTATPTIESVGTEQPVTTTQPPTETAISTPTTTTPTTLEPAAPIEPSSSQSEEPIASASDTMQATTVTSAPLIVTSSSFESSSSGSFSTSSDSETSEINSSDDSEEDEASIAKPGSDSSTFQSVASVECSEKEVDNIYTLYSNCRSAFDLCVSASNYQIFPFQGKHPTQTQVQYMAESDACVAVFIVVIQSNFSACTIVDLAKAAGVPYDGSSKLYAEFETNIDTALKNTTIHVNEDLSVDVHLSDGTYETFEDAIDLIVTDAGAADLGPGYVVASSATGPSSSSSSTTGVVIESSVATARCAPTLWSLHVVVAVVVSTVFAGRIT